MDFIADYEEIDNTRYYFLKVPYEMIEELHKTPFTKLRQPRSKNDVNDIEEMKGFQFIYTPEVECSLESGVKDTILKVSKFTSDPLNGCKTDNFSTLSSIFVNYDYNGEEFLMDDVRFWSEIRLRAWCHQPRMFRLPQRAMVRVMGMEPVSRVAPLGVKW